MPATPTPPAPEVADAIRISCERALRRLDVLIGERDDPVLHHVRLFVQQARALAAEQARVSAQA